MTGLFREVNRGVDEFFAVMADEHAGGHTSLSGKR
jgi:hypothetical protein